MERKERKTETRKLPRVHLKLVRSPIGSKPAHRRTLKALGLKRISSTVTHVATEPVMGMIRSVIHLITCEQVK